MSGITVAPAATPMRAARRRWGYLLWVIAGAVIGVPEITAAADGDALPFTTISGMTGHLERHHTWVELIVVALIALAVFSTSRISPRRQSGVSASGPPGQPVRTAGGRLTLRAATVTTTTQVFDDEDAPGLFALAAVVSLAAVAVGTWAAATWWDDARHYHPAYVLYGSLGLFWLVIPSVLAFALGRDMPFPTLFRTIANLEDWLRARRWPLTLGPIAAWLVAYVVFAGLAILLLHLTLDPYPDITRILNPGG